MGIFDTRSRIPSFISRLAAIEPLDNVTNHYSYLRQSGNNTANTIRRNNLGNYFHRMALISPNVALIGEAPGFRGCRLTGVPFTSEYLLLNGELNEWMMFQATREEETGTAPAWPGFQKTAETSTLSKEATATIVWETLIRLDCCPLLWNAFPFHPHKPEMPNSNRKPGIDELAIGEPFLVELLSLYEIDTIIAVGCTAARILHKLGLQAEPVRHPSHGGKADFVRGLNEIVSSH
jgi:uracil-DNA glycosylase